MPRARKGGTVVIALALAAGAAVTLYRNAAVHAAALSMGQEKSYLELETALGGPPSGLSRGGSHDEATHSLVSSVAAAAPSAAPTVPAAKQERSR